VEGDQVQCHCFCGKISRPGKVTFTVVFKPPKKINNTHYIFCCTLFYLTAVASHFPLAHFVERGTVFYLTTVTGQFPSADL